MKLFVNFLKIFKENLRDWKILALVVFFAPFFVFLMYFYYKGLPEKDNKAAILNLDEGGILSGELIDAWKFFTYEDGSPVLDLVEVIDEDSGVRALKEGRADVFIKIPKGFSNALSSGLIGEEASMPTLFGMGDPGNMRYASASSYIDYAAYNFVLDKAGMEVPLHFKYASVSGSEDISEFDLLVPGLLILSLIMVLFTAGASIIREVEKQTMIRLKLSGLSSPSFMAALAINQIIIGLAAFYLTLLSAYGLGYAHSGPIFALTIAGTLAVLFIVAVSIIVSCFIKNMFGLLTVGCFPFFIMMFFSDCFIPLPRIKLFELMGNMVYLNDLLPTSTAAGMINRIMNFKASFGDLAFEFVLAAVVTAAYWLAAMILFKRKYKF